MYTIFTFICGILLNIAGMPIFDSICHSMTTIATGGFSNYNQSIGFFESAKIEYVSIVFIILGSIPFISYITTLEPSARYALASLVYNIYIYIYIYILYILVRTVWGR